jgi:hypothetical protein
MPGGSGAWLIPHKPLPRNHHAFLAHGLVVADRQPFGDPATRPAVSWTPTFTHHAVVLGDRHDRSVLAEGGPRKAQRGPVDEGGAVNVGPATDLESSTVATVPYSSARLALSRGLIMKGTRLLHGKTYLGESCAISTPASAFSEKSIDSNRAESLDLYQSANVTEDVNLLMAASLETELRPTE